METNQWVYSRRFQSISFVTYAVSKREQAQLLKDFSNVRRTPPGGDENFEQYVVRTTCRRAYSKYSLLKPSKCSLRCKRFELFFGVLRESSTACSHFSDGHQNPHSYQYFHACRETASSPGRNAVKILRGSNFFQI